MKIPLSTTLLTFIVVVGQLEVEGRRLNESTMSNNATSERELFFKQTQNQKKTCTRRLSRSIVAWTTSFFLREVSPSAVASTMGVASEEPTFSPNRTVERRTIVHILLWSVMLFVEKLTMTIKDMQQSPSREVPRWIAMDTLSMEAVIRTGGGGI